jgi:hypothetical protein
MIRRKLFENFGHPRGVWGRLAGQVILIYGINVWQFWTDQSATIRHLAGRLGPAGRLALVYKRPPRGSTTGDEAGERLQKQFADAGLAAVETRTMAWDPPAVMVIGHRS